jgi:hypothetical protein
MGMSLGINRGMALNNTGGSGLSDAFLSGWFLASGEWDEDGFWRDQIPWADQEWFLDGGTWDRFGIWSDAEAW